MFMRPKIVRTPFVLLLPLFVVGCGQISPGQGDDTETQEGGDESSTDTSDTDEPDAGSYYPLVDGATWTYVARNSMGQVLGNEIVTAEAIDWEGESAWLLADNPNDKGEWTESTIVRVGSAAARVHKEIMSDAGPVMIVDYDPGFVRADDAWETPGFIEEWTYTRTETDGAGQNPKVEARGHSYEVLAVDQSVTVPAGTFDCIEIERVRTVGASAGEVVRFWYARDIGKVREERPAEGRIEELTEVSIPNGAEHP